MLGAFPLVLVNYLIPVIICYIPLPYWQYWVPGYFVTVAYKMNVWCDGSQTLGIVHDPSFKAREVDGRRECH